LGWQFHADLITVAVAAAAAAAGGDSGILML